MIQIAASEGIKTLNFIRNRFVLKNIDNGPRLTWSRENYKATEDHLLQLGATHVMTYDDLEDKRIRDKIISLTLGKLCSVLQTSSTI